MGRRPALVVSKDLFNRSTGLAIVCPVTNTDRGFPFHVAIPRNSKLTGFIMVEQVKSVDFRARRAKRIEHGNVVACNEGKYVNRDAFIRFVKIQSYQRLMEDNIFFKAVRQCIGLASNSCHDCMQSRTL
ncbi:type II toxin-antitoxin system PemK/MazF family toxin [Desulfosarcina ovata]|nr:type II toxin-antitoxin system PemK/MazF family toxin [Desulfosarcina ovata]